MISEALPMQKVQVLMFNFKHEEFVNEAGEKEEIEVCTNTRYARRHDSNLAAKKPQSKLEESKIEQSERPTPKKKDLTKNQKGSTANIKKGDKTKSTEELETIAIEQEAERQRKKAEAEAAAAEAAEAKKDKIRPKEYTADEKKAWREYAENMQIEFGNLCQQIEVAKEEDPEKEYGTRTMQQINVEYNYTYLCEYLCSSVVPEPIWPDPDKEPLPPPVISSILKKPPNRAERNKITKFSIHTPNGEPAEDETLPPMSDATTRWVLGPKESKKLYIKFFST